MDKALRRMTEACSKENAELLKMYRQDIQEIRESFEKYAEESSKRIDALTREIDSLRKENIALKNALKRGGNKK